MVDLDLTLCYLKRQGTSDAQDIKASVPVTLKRVTLTTFALEGKDIQNVLDKHDESDDICVVSFF